jgi:deoxyribose-phosphate aldolase
MQDIARLIDHTLLRADATFADIEKLCDVLFGMRKPSLR